MDRAILRTVAAAFAGGVTGSVLTLAAIVLLAALVGGCGSAPPPPRPLVPVSAAARSYLAAHPIPPRPGMTGGVITWPSNPWLPIAHCPHRGRGSVGGPGTCGAWAVVLMTSPGHSVTVRCGSQDHGIPCPGGLVPPEAGGLVYVPASLTLASIDQVVVVSQDVLNVQVDGPDGIWAPAPERSAP